MYDLLISTYRANRAKTCKVRQQIYSPLYILQSLKIHP